MTVTQAAADFLSGHPLFSALSQEEIAELAWTARPFHLETGEVLCRQGAPADEMFVVRNGCVELSIRIAGSEERTIGTAGAGSVLGETALISGGLRSATARALQPTDGCALHRRAFEVLRAGYRPSAAKVLRRLAALISSRIVGRTDGGQETPDGPPTDLAPFRRPAAGLDVEHLRALPFLAGFDRREVETLLEEFDELVVPRGTTLFRQGDLPDACYITIRGAVEICVERNGRRDKLALQGPGMLFGEAGLFNDHRRSATAWARERSNLLEIDRRTFDRLFAGQSTVAFKFFDAAVVLLVGQMRRSVARKAWFETERREGPAGR